VYFSFGEDLRILEGEREREIINNSKDLENSVIMYLEIKLKLRISGVL